MKKKSIQCKALTINTNFLTIFSSVLSKVFTKMVIVLSQLPAPECCGKKKKMFNQWEKFGEWKQ